MRSLRIWIGIIVAALAATAQAADFMPIPLNAVVNRTLVDETTGGTGQGGWADQGKENSLTGFPTGEIRLGDVPFSIPDKGAAAVLFRGKAMAAVSGLPVEVSVQAPPGARGTALYVLATAVQGGNEIAHAADLTIEFTDAPTQTLTLEYGRHVGGWWLPKPLTGAIVAWKGKNGLGNEIGVYLAPLALKNGGGTVRRITIRANDEEKPSLALLGLTVGTRKPADILPPSRQWQPWTANDMTGWWPLEVHYDRAEQPAAWENAMEFFGQEAGASGWTKAAEDNLEFEKTPGQAVRFKGICAGGTFFYPPLSQSPRYAAVLRKFGYNQVRFHSIFDELLVQKNGYALPKYNAERLERFDKIFADLKKQGIYSLITMLFTTRWDSGLDVTAADKIQPLNNTFYFYNEKHQELYLKMLREFLEHRNAFTGLRYADDPALNMIQALNECSLFFYTTDAVPGPYKLELQDKWNQHLRRLYQTQANLVDAWRVEGQRNPLQPDEDLSQGTVALLGIFDLANAPAGNARRAADQTRFYQGLEEAWFKRVREVVRQTGSKALVQGSSWGGPRHLQEIQSAASASVDFTGKHTYWYHPLGGWDWDHALFFNQPVTKHPADHILTPAFQHVEDKPFTITEWQFCMPNDYINDGPVFTAAYGAMQNFSATHRFALGTPEFSATLGPDFFNCFAIPGSMATEPLAYFLFVRGDVQPAPLIYRDALPPARLHDAQRKIKQTARESGNRFFMGFDAQAVPDEAMLVGGVRLGLGQNARRLWDEKAFRAGYDEQAKTITSNTGELVWNYGQGWIAVNTPRSRAVMGCFANAAHQSGPLSFQLNNAYGVVGWASLDGKPLEQSGRILLTLTGRQRNTGQTFDELMEGGQGVRDQPAFRVGQTGRAPIMMEPVRVSFKLQTSHPGPWRLIPLDLNGYPQPDAAITLQMDGQTLSGEVDNVRFHALNYVLTAGAEK